MPSIWYRRDRKQWRVSYQAPDGKQIRKQFKTKRMAQTFYEDVVVAGRTCGLGALAVATMIMFRDLIDEYMEWAVVNKAAKTMQDERWIINANILPFFGRYTLSQVSVRLLERYKLRRQQDGVGNRTINYELQIISVMFRRAIEWEYVSEKPVAKAKRLKLTKSRRAS